ncbi:MAG: calcium/sodium antiporter [Clostridia bacterium]|nr:calcium/sodium antiporter [Clostridia bacterium]
MVINILLIIFGFVLLIKGADILVDGASNIAKKFNIPEMIIGLTIVAIGTSTPELVVSATASIEGHSDLAIGNVVGSNIANLFLILGICSIIKGLIFKKETKIFENPFTIFCTVLLFFLANNKMGGYPLITKKEGIVLLLICIIFIIYNIIMSKKGNNLDNKIIELDVKENHKISIFSSIISIILGTLSLKIGGDFVVDNASGIATLCGISEKMISLTIVAFSTSLPELITSITATKKGDTDMAIGNILGSQIFNILLIIGISAVLSPIPYSIKYNNDILLLSVGTIILALFPFIGRKNEMTRFNGIIFLIIYITYMLGLILFNL